MALAPQAHIDEGLVYCERTGTAPPVVLIHGVAGSHRIWDPLVPYLTSHYTVLRVDLTGYGSSPAWVPECTPTSHAEAIRRSAARLVEPPYTLIGLSMGTNIALSYACRWPDEVAALIGLAFPYFGTTDEARSGLSNNFWTRLALSRPRLAATVLPPTWSILRHSGLTNLHRGIYTPEMARDALRVDYRSFESSMRTCMLDFAYDDALACTSKKRRLFIHGSEDTWATSEQVGRAVASFTRTEFEVIPGAPHNVVVTEPERTATIIKAYLDSMT